MATAQTRLSATILLLRDGLEQLEVFMVERHHKIDFAEGALVFPGGKVETSDSAPELADFCRDAESSSADDRTLRVAAIRETFEECGVLLARPRGEDRLVDGARLQSISNNHLTALKNHDLKMAALVRAENLELAFDLLVPFAHWITPEFMPKRFDTHFFLVAAPSDQLAIHDGYESVDSLWTTIPRAIELEKSGQRTIIFPTLENIKKLGRSQSVGEALDNARQDTIVTVLPKITKQEDGTMMMELPEDAGYETIRAPVFPGGKTQS
ncbi:MAG TPA: NUDIX domain-containing protein [Myxococcales bacterium]|nr:NUDIX domain-containing protein [Myxococcales bacterium]HIK85650.1 NUDIX domain-containing protein [Myxococcales bacterium]